MAGEKEREEREREIFCGSIDEQEGTKRWPRRRLKGAPHRTPAAQFCTRRGLAPERGTPVVIIRGPSECFWPS